MGAQQAFQWAVSYPDFADRIVATSGTAKTYGHGIVRLEGQIAALTADRDVQQRRLHDAAQEGHGSVRHGVGRRGSTRRSGGGASCGRRTPRPARRSSNTCRRSAPTSSSGADANDIILQARTWEKHDVGTTPGFDGDVERALRSIKVPFLYMPSETDLYFPVGDARYEAQFMSTVSLVPIPSLWGHPAGAGANPAGPRLPEHDDRARFSAAADPRRGRRRKEVTNPARPREHIACSRVSHFIASGSGLSRGDGCGATLRLG